MNNIISKKHQLSQQDTYITYRVENLDNYDSVVSLCSDLVSKGIIVDKIYVNVYSNDGILEEDVFSYNTLQEYLSEYNKSFTDNSISGIALSCLYNNLKFKINVNSKIKRISIVAFGLRNENEFNLDEVVSRAITKH